MDILYLLKDFDNNYNILDNLNFKNIINILFINKVLNTTFNKKEKFWKICCILYKDKHFWNLSKMRNEKQFINCDNSLTFKQQLRNIFFYDKLLNNTNTNYSYYYQWLMIEYYNNNNDIVYNMIKYLLENNIIQIKSSLLENFSLKTILNILKQKNK